MAKDNNKLSSEPYKGVRDFYPEDMELQKAMFENIRYVSESFGFQEYSASVLEPAELYASKTSDEIVNEQTYTFEDRGGRMVTLRPEMTPTVARMVAARRRELAAPIRWYSIPNLFRYERPQRGRLREHWQFNADIFGVADISADTEIVMLAHSILISYGATEEHFKIHIHSRKLLNAFYSALEFDEEKSLEVSRLIDRKNKMETDAFEKALNELVGDKAEDIMTYLNAQTMSDLPEQVRDSEAATELETLFNTLTEAGITNAIFDPTIVRGFDYYTGPVFEIFDTAPDNNRSMFGGGRYDNLLSLFGEESMPAVGIAAGDVTLADFLETHNISTENIQTTDLMLCPFSPEFAAKAQILARELRGEGLNVATYLGTKKVRDQIAQADKKRIPFIIVVGEDETASGTYTLKHLPSGKETSCTQEDIPQQVISTVE